MEDRIGAIDHPAEVPARPARLKRGARRWRGVAVALGLAAALGVSWPMLRAPVERAGALDGSSRPALESPPPIRVDVVHPEPGGIRRLTIQPGTVHPFEWADLVAKASGYLRSQAVDIGSTVRQGQVLAEIDAPELAEDVEQAASALDQANAQVEQGEARIATTEAELAAAAAAELQARADLDRLAAKRSMTQKSYERVRELNARNAIERKVVDEHQFDFDAATAGEATGRAAIATAGAQVKTAEARVRQARADLVEARAFVRVVASRLGRARVVAGYLQIRAPFDGVVTRRNFHPGAFVRSAADGTPVALLTVARTDLMRVIVQVPDLDVPLLDPGDKVTILVDSLKGRPFVGQVARVARSEDPTTRTMRAEVDLPNPDGRLVEGMYGRATIELQPPNGHLTVPSSCLVGHTAQGKPSAFVVRDARARRVAIAVGDDDGSTVEVLAGLQAGDQVILRPPPAIEEGAAVSSTLAQGPAR